MRKILVAIFATAFITACEPGIGSEKWCANLKDKPKGEWTLNETTDYAKHCIL